MQQIVIDGKSIAYQSRLVYQPVGSLIFVHGSGGDHHKWDDLMQQLPQQFSGVAIDLPGHAASQGPLLKTIAEGAKLLSKLPDLLNLPRPIWLVGHSMGSAMAISTALDYASQIDGLILIGTGSRMRVLPTLLAALQAGKKDPTLLRWGFAGTTPTEIIERELSAFEQIPVEVLYNDFTACDHFDRSGDVARINLPTLLIVGEDDKLTPLKYARQLHDSIPGSKLVVISQAGHMVMLEKPAEVSQIIAEFVEKYRPMTEVKVKA